MPPQSAGSAGSYFGLVPRLDSSAGKDRRGHITREGPVTVRKLLTEAAWQAIRLDPASKALFERVTRGKPDRRKIAAVAVAHRLCRVMAAMLRSGEVYRDGRAGERAGTWRRVIVGEAGRSDRAGPRP